MIAGQHVHGYNYLVFCIATIHTFTIQLYGGLTHTNSKIQLVAYCMGNFFLMCYKAMAYNIGRQSASIVC